MTPHPCSGICALDGGLVALREIDQHPSRMVWIGSGLEPYGEYLGVGTQPCIFRTLTSLLPDPRGVFIAHHESRRCSIALIVSMIFAACR